MLDAFSNIERRARRELPRRLDELVGGAFHVAPPPAGDEGFDFLILGPVNFIVEAKASANTLDPHAIAARLTSARRERADTQALLVVPYMSPAVAARCRDAGLSWLDLSGNADISAPSLRVHVEGRPNRFPERGRPSTPFGPKGSRVTRALLQDPARWMGTRQLSEVVELPPGTVSRTLAALEERGLVLRDGDRRVRPRDPDELLDAWRAEVPREFGHASQWHVPAANGVDVARIISRRLTDQGIRHALTGLAAAWCYDQGYASFRTSTIYAPGDVEFALRDLGIRSVERGANLRIIDPADDGVFQFEQAASKLPCVTLVQTIVDLEHAGERAPDAAAHLRERGLW